MNLYRSLLLVTAPSRMPDTWQTARAFGPKGPQMLPRHFAVLFGALVAATLFVTEPNIAAAAPIVLPPANSLAECITVIGAIDDPLNCSTATDSAEVSLAPFPGVH